MATKNYGVMRPHKNDGVMLLSHVMTEDEAARKVDRLNRIVQDDDYFQIVALPAEDDAEKLARVQRLCRALGVAVPQRLPPPTSLCTCGHTGNAAQSQHGPRYSPGHGACKVSGCGCKQFTYAAEVRS